MIEMHWNTPKVIGMHNVKFFLKRTCASMRMKAILKHRFPGICFKITSQKNVYHSKTDEHFMCDYNVHSIDAYPTTDEFSVFPEIRSEFKDRIVLDLKHSKWQISETAATNTPAASHCVVKV